MRVSMDKSEECCLCSIDNFVMIIAIMFLNLTKNGNLLFNLLTRINSKLEPIFIYTPFLTAPAGSNI